MSVLEGKIFNLWLIQQVARTKPCSSQDFIWVSNVGASETSTCTIIYCFCPGH